MQRLYAIDLLDRLVQPIDIVWYFNLELEVKVNCRRPGKSTEASQDDGKQNAGNVAGSKHKPTSEISRDKKTVRPWNPNEMKRSRLSRNKRDTLEHDTRLKYMTANPLDGNSVLLDMLTRSEAKGGTNIWGPTNSLRNPVLRHGESMDVVGMVQDEFILSTGTGNTNKHQNSGTSGTGGSHKDRHPSDKIRHQLSQQASEQSSLIYFFGTVMASVAPPTGICDMLTLEENRQCCLESSFSRLVGIQDLGTNMSLSYSNNFSLSHMSVYDDSYDRPGLDSSWNTGVKQKNRDTDPKDEKTPDTHAKQRARLGEGSLVWAVTQFGDTINGFDQISSQVQQIANVSHMLNTSVQVTSRVMVAIDPKTHADLLLFAVRRVNKTQPHSSYNATNYLVALDTSFGDGQQNIMWTLPVPYDYEVQGQIAVLEVPWVKSSSPLLVATAQGPVSQIAFAFNFTQIA